MDSFSVLMSLYYKDNPDYFIKAIHSIFSQDIKPNQVVLVLDGPLKEDLQMAVDNLSDVYSELDVFPLPENKGLSAALRFGLKKCRNELVFRMDSDDVCYSSRFEEMIQLFCNHPDLDVAGSYAKIIDENGVEGKIMKVPTSEQEIYKKVWTCPFIHPTVCFKKSSLLSIGSYNENPGPRQDDYELWFRVVGAGLHCMNLSKPLLYYRFTPENVVRNNVYVGWARLKVGIRGVLKCKCGPIAYIGVAYPLFRSLMPRFVRDILYKFSDVFNPRVK